MMCPSLIILYKTCFKELFFFARMLHLEMYAIKYVYTIVIFKKKTLCEWQAAEKEKN